MKNAVQIQRRHADQGTAIIELGYRNGEMVELLIDFRMVISKYVNILQDEPHLNGYGSYDCEIREAEAELYEVWLYEPYCKEIKLNQRNYDRIAQEIEKDFFENMDEWAIDYDKLED
jgi:hypothetical protein